MRFAAPADHAGIHAVHVASFPTPHEADLVDGLAACTRRHHGFVVVLGDPRYYRRFGFTAARAWAPSDEYGGGDAFQALELRPGAIPAAGGLVRYAPELG